MMVTPQRRYLLEDVMLGYERCALFGEDGG
jgi:hypothetical protein